MPRAERDGINAPHSIDTPAPGPRKPSGNPMTGTQRSFRARAGRSWLLSALFYAAVQELDRYAFGPADEADAHPGSNRGRLAGELDPLALSRRRGVDAGHRKAEMIKPAIGRRRRRVNPVAGRTSAMNILAPPSFRSMRGLPSCIGGALRRRAFSRTIAPSLPDLGAQMNVVEGKCRRCGLRHDAFTPCNVAAGKLGHHAVPCHRGFRRIAPSRGAGPA